MRRGFLGIIVGIILLLNLFIIPTFNCLIEADSEVNKFSDDTVEKIIIIPDAGTSFEVALPEDTMVLNATMKLTLVNDNNQYPYNPQLILGSPDGTDWSKTLWAFDQAGYGALGHLEFFTDGTSEKEVAYLDGQVNDRLKLFLPASAEVSSAKINLTASEFDHLSPDVIELNPEPDGAGDYEPDMTVFKNSLFTVFRSYNSAVTNGSDSDVVINSTADGVNWSGMVELRNVPDSNPPYDNPFESADWRPTLEKFKGKLYCAWESNSTTTTSGPDRDIILRSSADGITWGSNVINVTDEWEDDYSSNPGLKNDWDAGMVVFNNSLWLIWTSNNTGPESGYKSPANDIMLSNSSDGVTWRNATDLTAGDDWYTNDYGPQMIVFNNSLYAVWSSNNTMLNKGIDDEQDYDIIYRNSSDGVIWSAPQVLNPNDNLLLGKKGAIDIQPALATTGNKLFCAWASASDKYTDGTDFDIVLGYTTDGNFTEVKNHFEITEPVNSISDYSPTLIAFNNRMYVTWVSELSGNVDVHNKYLSIPDEHLGVLRRVNPVDTGGADYAPAVEVFNNKLYTAWISNDTQTGTGYDKDIILRTLEPSYLPVGIGIDIGGDEFYEIPIATQLTNQSIKFDLTAGLRNILANDAWVSQNSSIREYGNVMSRVPISIYFSGPSKIHASNLSVYYNYSFTLPDFSDDLNYYINLKGNEIKNNGELIIPFTLTSDTAGKLKVSELKIVYNHKPKISILDIGPGGKEIKKPVYRIRWSAEDVDDNASISLYYDSDDVGYDGELIIANLSEDGLLEYYDWVWWETIPDGGIAYIYANITDGKFLASNYSSGPLILGEIIIQDYIDITVVEPDGIDDEAWDTFEIKWNSYCPDDDAKIQLFYDNDNTGFDGYAIDINENGYFDSGDYITESEGDGIGAYTWDITKLSKGMDYYVYARITNKWNLSIYNYSTGILTRTHMSAPRDFTLLDDTDLTDDNLTTHKINPQLSWSRPDTDITDNLEYVLTVRNGNNKSSENYEIVYNITTVATSTTILNGLEYGRTYYAEIYARTTDDRKSVKNEITFQVVNHVPEAPIISISPIKPKTTDILLCSIIDDSFDADNDIVNYSFYWYKDNELQTKYTNLITIPSEATVKGERWECTVVPDDGIKPGHNASFEVFIRNSPPEISVIKPVSDKKYKDSDAIFFNFSVYDPDVTDRGRLNYTVYSNNEVLRAGYVPSISSGVEFYHEMSKGTHNLRFNISDGESNTETEIDIVIEGRKPDEQESAVLYGFYAIVIVLIILFLVFFVLLSQIRRMRRGVDEIDEEELVEEEPDIMEE
jgi:hypothetical protein